jgi:hypothetical protein
MTRDEFMCRYHHYRSDDGGSARAEAALVNADAAGFRVVAVEFPGLGWALMLDTAAEYAAGLFPGIKPDRPEGP